MMACQSVSRWLLRCAFPLISCVSLILFVPSPAPSGARVFFFLVFDSVFYAPPFKGLWRSNWAVCPMCDVIANSYQVSSCVGKLARRGDEKVRSSPCVITSSDSVAMTYNVFLIDCSLGLALYFVFSVLFF